VPDELLNVILDCAIRAPSGRNSQPCHLRIVQDKKLLDQMNTDFKNIVGWDTPAYTGWDKRPVYHNAPTFIFIFAISPNIVINECASPCRHLPKNIDCVTSCERITLFDVIMGRG
jgi:hypothetical protein